MLESIIGIAIVLGLVEPKPPREVCILNQVWLLYPSSIKQTNKQCTDEPCIAWPPKKPYNRKRSVK